MTKLRPSNTASIIFLTALLLLAATASAAPQSKIAEVENLGSTLVFDPFVDYDTVTLTVTGPCGYSHRAVFDRNETPYWKIEEGVTIDGAYTYELQTRPILESAIVDVLDEARRNFDEETPKQLCREGRLPPAPRVQAQGFTIAGFEILYDPSSLDEGSDSAPGKHGELSRLDTSHLDTSRLGGFLVDPRAEKDQVISDDLIVDGSACIGNNCVDGESFAFDTIRLKENNLRIKFEDTSTSESFPSNDWQLIVNDSGNGGADRFSIGDVTHGSIPFTVEGGAPSNSLYVDDGGRIGHRTSTPLTEFHAVDGDTATIRLEQNGSAGFTPQTWDIGSNEFNFFVRDATVSGSNLPFRIRPGAPTSSIDIGADGNVGVGTDSPSFNLHVVSSSSGTRDLIRLENNGTTRISMLDTSTNDEWQFANNGGANAFVITAQGSGAAEFSLNRADNAVNPGRLTIMGDIVTGGGTCGSGCDALFKNEIESIEEHAAYMWENSHLPAVGPTSPNEPWNLTEKTSGILSELEKAHIYIDQLNSEFKSEIEKKDRRIVDLEDRLARLEALVDAHID